MLYIAAFFGHRKARLLVRGQRETVRILKNSPKEKLDKWRGCVWVHAASVGEFEQARPIIERLRAENPCEKIVLTFFSPSGYEMRKHYDKVDTVLYLPFATRRNARLFISTLQPKKAVFVKYEFWPAYLSELKKQAVPAFSISAIFRPKQLFFLPWGKPYLRLLHCFTHIYVQDQASLALLQAHGISRCSVAGDTRFDRVNQLATLPSDISEGVSMDDKQHLLIAGSTWQQDEQLLARYIDTHPDIRLLLVPHEITDSHLHQIFQFFHGRYMRLSELTFNSQPSTLNPQPSTLPAPRVIVVDKMGLLSKLYRYGAVAYIGGGFGAGIHNTIEAAVYGMPVVFGPKYQHFREAKALIAAGAGFSISNYKQLEHALDNAFAHADELGQKARTYVESELGATDKIYRELFSV
ncbi:MAG: 3-deoxy-D-manno-octulosonic acid transferase [Paludibacteraceae bacterium]